MKIEITPNIYQLNSSFGAGVWGANIFLLIDGDELTLIDTGFKGRAASVLSEIMKMGYTPSSIKRILITHHHIDHVGSLFALKKASGATIFAHQADIPYINGTLPHPGPIKRGASGRLLALALKFWENTPLDVDVSLKEGEELPVLGGIEVVHTPGHTPGCISFLLPKEGVVIVGDLLSHGSVLRLPAKDFTIDPVKEIESIGKLATLDFETICFGHGKPIVGGALPVIRSFAEEKVRKYGTIA
jgi:glyoxylase-like metal-dependent hydrolase (beta-lactamase superfamily II)